MKNKIGKIVIAWLLVICMIAPMLPDVINANATDVTDGNNYDAMSMEEIFGQDKSLTWVFAGDSITHNQTFTQGMNSYSEWFEQYLYDIGRKDDSVILSAWTGADIFDFQKDGTTYPEGQESNETNTANGKGLENMITKYNPDVIFIKIGMNDRDQATDVFKQYYTQMLDDIYAAGAANGTTPKIPKIVALTPTPVSSENAYDDMHLETIDLETVADVQDSTLRIRNAVEDVVNTYNEANSRKLAFCDLRTAFLEEALVLGDDYHRTFFGDPSDGHLHPNAAGQYFMFKTLCETLERDMTSLSIFQIDYDDINSGTLYVDGTDGVDYSNSYADTNGIDDATEMAKDLAGKRLLASVDFTANNGDLGIGDGENNYVDLVNGDEVQDKLTLTEVQSMDKEYSIIFRAKLLTPENAGNQPIFYLSADSSKNIWGTNTLSLGLPGNDKMYYGMTGGSKYYNTATNWNNKSAFVDDDWHTFAIVQAEEGMTIYVDGVGTVVKRDSTNTFLTKTIGETFANPTAFEAMIGKYGSQMKQEDGGYYTEGNFDYWQLYNGALTPEEVVELTNAGGAVDDVTEMNKSMTTIDGVSALASVEFDSTNGTRDKNTTHIDLTKKEGVVSDELTLEEVQSLGKTYTVVLRGKMAAGTGGSQSILYLASDKTKGFGVSGNNDLMLGLPGTGKMWYSMVLTGGWSDLNTTFNGNAEGVNSNNENLNNTFKDYENWHTFVIVQDETSMTAYMDGDPYTVVKSGGTTLAALKNAIGSYFADDSNYEAVIGSYGETDNTYRLNGKFDYWQLYDSALTAENAMTLTDAAEMNCTMPTLSTALTQNVLASVQFAEENSVLGGTENPYVDLTDSEQVDDPLQLTEVQSMGKEYTVAFRAKLTDPSAGNQSVFFVGSGASGNGIWDSENLILNIPGSKTGGWYHLKNSEGATVSSFGTFHNYAEVNGTISEYKTKESMVDNNWHTFVYVQNEDNLTLYIDGQPYVMKQNSSGTDAYLNDSIGNTFANTEEFVAYIGKLQGETKTDYSLDGQFDYWTLYDGAFTPEQVQSITEVVESDVKTTKWSDTLGSTKVWAVAGAEQMSGYEGPVVNRSLFRLLDNSMRGTGSSYIGTRMVNVAAPDYTVDTIYANQSTVLTNYSPDVYMLLPEVSAVYDTANYAEGEHETKVAAYKETINNIVTANETAGVITVLWTPLASDNTTVNEYLADYAIAVREIVKANSDVLFFDAYRFMNDNMDNAVLKRNWFENNGYISPLCAVDLTYAFYVAVDKLSISTSELTSHNMRLSSDTRVFRSNYVSDNISATAEVDNNTKNIAIDLTNIFNVYSSDNLTDIKIKWAKEVGTGNENVKELAYTVEGNVYTVAAPCNNPVFAIYGTYNGMTYRFADVKVAVTGVTEQGTTSTPTGVYLDSLNILGAPEFGFASDVKEYNDVELYQYQKHVQVCATAQAGLTIEVNGTEVKSGENSQLIDVTEVPTTITVSVSDGTSTETYTLNLVREDCPDLIITEVMQDGYNKYTTTTGNDNYELIEIYNASGETLNLLDYSIGYKLDTPESNQSVNKGEWPYYFTGNNQAFSGKGATYTGINQITNYSTYDENGAETATDRVDFPANSTMVIWVKFAPQNVVGDAAETYMDSLTYTSLIEALEAHKEAETLVVPNESQLVIAEIPKDTATVSLSTETRVNKTAETCTDNFYMENNSDYRSWLFVLKDDATQAENGSITNEGNNIISAAKFARIGDAPKLSSVFSYNAERGMSLVKNEATWDTTSVGTPHTSDEQGYSNATTFGAIEYWQKPANAKDAAEPVVTSSVSFEDKDDKANATVNFTVADDTDIRYVEFYVRKTGEETWTEVIKKDLVFEECVENTGLAADQTTYTFSYQLALTEEGEESVEYWGKLVDGSGNEIPIGSKTTPVGSCKYETKKYTQQEVIDYIDGDNTYPSDVDGYLFAGWYKNEETSKIANAIASIEDVPEDGAYALYIPKHVLGVYAQVSKNLTDNDLSDDGTGAIRFVTSVDSLNYNKAGFYFSFGESTTEFERSNNMVYDKLFGVNKGQIDKTEVLTEYTPKNTFCTQSNYFKTHAFVDIAQNQFDLQITATPFYETLDGTIVRGTAVTKCINDGRGSEWIYLDGSNGDDANIGTKDAPVKTLENALTKAGNNGVVYVVGEYAMPAEFAWPVSESFVAITGDTLNCEAITKGQSLNIRSAVRFDGITLKFTDGMWIWANGNEVTIAENVTVEGIPQYIFGGALNGNVDSTNLTVLTGNYQMIFGGCYGKGYEVSGNTYLHVGGDVNADLDDTYERLIYGGGYHGTVKGSTTVFVDGNVNENKTCTNLNAYLYGGGRNGAVGGSTDVTVKGNAIFNGIYGGGHHAKTTDGSAIVSGNTKVTVDENVNNALALSDINTWSNDAAVLYGGGNLSDVEGSTEVIAQGNAQFTHIYGGGLNSTVQKNTSVLVTDNVNAYDTKLNKGWIFGGGYGSSASATINGTAKVIVKGQARAMYIFGAGRAANSSVNATDITVSGSAALNSVYGGGFNGTNGDTQVAVEGGTVGIVVGAGYGVAMEGDTKVVVTGGTINEVYGGSDSANVTGDTEVAVLGGKIVQQVYGGCKNSGAPSSNKYSVTGYTSVKLGANADLDISTGDKAIYAVSRSTANADSEKGIFIINDYRNNANKFEAGTNGNTTVAKIKSHHYFVNVSSGGEVSVQDSGLAITPDEGFKAIIKDSDDTVLATYSASDTYILPAYEGSEVVLYVEFEKINPDTIYISESGSDETGDGTQESPYATLNYALKMADNGDTISVVASSSDPYDVTSDSWEVHGKAVTITGGMMEFSTLSTLNIHDSVTFDNITLGFKNDAKVYANGYAVTMGENVVFNNGAYIYIYGAGSGTTVMDTNLKLLAGDYHKIFGAGNGGTVLGDTRLHIAGTVNETRSFDGSNACVVFGAGTGNAIVNGDTNVYVGGDANSNLNLTSSNKESAVVYGACESGTVKGDTNVTIAGNAKVVRLHGGGYDGTVEGDAHVTVNGDDVNSGLSCSGSYSDDVIGAYLYGGGYIDEVIGDTYINITGNARFNAIYGGGRGYNNGLTSAVIGGNTNVTVGGNVNADLSFDAVGFAYIFGGARMGTVSGTTSVTVTDNANFYGIFGGGSTSSSVCGDTTVIVNGNVNAGLTIDNVDASHSKVATVFGGSYQGTAGNTNVTIGDSAHLNYVFGGGSTSTSVAGDTSVTFNGTGARAYSIYGGSLSGTNTSTFVEMTAGWVAQVFGGCEDATMTGDTNVRILGGTVTRRIYGGCYNECKKVSTLSYEWVANDYHVKGISSVTIGSGATISLNAETDNGLFATSRYKTNNSEETGIFILNNCNVDEFGQRDYATELVMDQGDSHHYLVNVSLGGNVYIVDGALKVVADDGYTFGSITCNGTALTMDDNGNYELPSNTGSTITVEFTKN